MKRKMFFWAISLMVIIIFFYMFKLTMFNKFNDSAIVSKNINDSLSLYLTKYISKTDPLFLNVECKCYRGCIYYNVYFFEKDNISFFMFLTWLYIGNRYDFTKDNQIYLEYLNNRKVVFFMNTHETKESSLYKKNFIARKRAWSELKLKEPCPMYSGSLYPETYKYKTENGKVLIEKADSLFYESFVGADFARFENLFITMPNGYRKNKTHD